MADPRFPQSLEDAARLIGHFVWIESRLFEVMGGWVATVPEPAVKLLLDEHARHHAWHASLWSDRLPALAEMDPGQFTVPATAEIEVFVAALAAAGATLPAAPAAALPAADEPDRTVERLVGVYRVVMPWMATAYTGHLDRASRITDGPTIRALNLVLTDTLADWRVGEDMVQRQLLTATHVRRAAGHQASLEALLVAAGGIGMGRR